MSRVRLLIGTRKGAFILTSDATRQSWQISEPHFPGWELYHLKASPADPNRIYASQTSGWFGQQVQRSDDGGLTFSPVDNQFTYADAPGTHQWYDGTPHPWEFKRVWHLEPSLTDPDTCFAGVEDAGLFKTTDGGKSWNELPGLRHTESGPHWQPGAGGLCLHTILLDPTNPDRIVIAISAAGAFRSDDAGKTWKPINKGLHSKFLPNPNAEVGHCVHHIAMNPRTPNTLFMQKHWDVLRSDDAGDHWTKISGNLPTDFGFAIDVHRPPARNRLRRPHQVRLRALPPRRQAASLPQQIRRQRVGAPHQRPPAKRLLRQHPPRRHGRRHPRRLRHLLRHHRRPGLLLPRRRRKLAPPSPTTSPPS